jgi:hypothetical protein
MWMVLAAAALPAALTVALAIVHASRRRALGLELPIAAAGVVCFEAALVQALSPAHAVGRAALAAVHLVLLAVALWVGPRVWSRAVRRPRSWPSFAAIAALAVLPFVSAAEYVPNNWDSMTYHLARVAHWLQNGSVAYYPTSIARQFAYPPGAEYLLLVVHAIAGSDRLANFVQLGAWLLVAASGPELARALGASRRIAPWAGVFAASLPMALLQASSTQNDLVAALTALAAVSASLPFLHTSRRWTWRHVAWLAAACAAAGLVKASGVVAAAPFVAAAVLAAARSRGTAVREGAAGLAVTVALAVATLGGWIALRGDGRSASDPIYASFVYGAAPEAGDRVANLARGVARHVPVPEVVEAALAPTGKTVGCGAPGTLCASAALLRAHEDFAGAPGQALLVLALLTIGALRWRALPARARITVVSVALSWVAFQVLFRDNVWISRLHLAAFATSALAFAALAARSAAAALPARWVAPCMVGLAAYGMWVSARNELRPPTLDPGRIVVAGSPAAYYTSAGPELWAAHDVVLAALGVTRCSRLGLRIGEDGYDYPLTWRAMAAGVEVRHLVGPDAWPCLVYSEDGEPPPRPDGSRWAATEYSFIFAVPDPLVPRGGRE